MFYKFHNYLYHLIQLPVVLRGQWRSPESIIAMQNRKLSKIVKHAYKEVPYYRELFDSLNLKPSDIQTKQDLLKIPILTKDLIKINYPDRILAKNIDFGKCSVRQTAGSSGNILEVVLDLQVTFQYHLQQFRQLVDIGYVPTDKIAYIRYSTPITKTSLQKFGLFRRDHVQLTLNPKDQIRQLMAIKPNIINAYPSVLYLLAKNISRQEANYLSLKFILSNSELLYESARRTIENTFNCKVYDDYSCLEFSSIAFECKYQHLHVTCDNVVAEVVDDDGQLLPHGKKGRLLLTALNNKTMPFLRYEIGDIGSIGSPTCPCGRGFPIIRSLVGRRDDFLMLPDGSLLDPQSAVFQVEIVPGVMQFQLVQTQKNILDVNVVIDNACDKKSVISQIRTNLRTVIPHDVRLTINVVDELEKGATGKLRSVRSMLIH